MISSRNDDGEQLNGSQHRPVLVNELLVLSDSGSSRVGCPVARRRVEERNVNVGVVLDLLALQGNIVGEKNKIQL